METSGIKLRHVIVACLISTTILGCASLSKTQIKSVQTFYKLTDSVTSSPVKIWSSLNDVRVDRYILSVSTLSNNKLLIDEIDSIRVSWKKNNKIGDKLEQSFELMNAYSYALTLLASPEKWESSGRGIKSLGRNIDSLIIRYNSLGFKYELPSGYGKSISRALGYSAETYFKHRQIKLLRRFIVQGDTIFARLCDNLYETLNSDSFRLLISTEKKGVRDQFHNYANLKQNRGEYLSFLETKEFYRMSSQIEEAENLRISCCRRLKSLKSAHNRLSKEIQQRKRVDELLNDIYRLSDEISKFM